mmetsp:Transcript_5612/g.14023  ORF Transcript_5612/g.14023 Transcript_5612/m.14023 type:complete len:100 (-) Transcript_5612:560-859(-)
MILCRRMECIIHDDETCYVGCKWFLEELLYEIPTNSVDRFRRFRKMVIYSVFFPANSDTLSTSSEAVVSADFLASAMAVSMRDMGLLDRFFKKSFRKLS